MKRRMPASKKHLKPKYGLMTGNIIDTDGGRRRGMIELRNISKTFRVAKRNAGFGEAVKALFRKEYTYINALCDVSFTVGDGEMVGYIGPNGRRKKQHHKNNERDTHSGQRRMHNKRAHALEGQDRPCAGHRRGLRPEVAALVGTCRS